MLIIMPIKKNSLSGYLIIEDKFLSDNRLRLQTKLLYVALHSLDDYIDNLEENEKLQSICRMDSLSINSALNELAIYGYLKNYTNQGENVYEL